MTTIPEGTQTAVDTLTKQWTGAVVRPLAIVDAARPRVVVVGVAIKILRPIEDVAGDDHARAGRQRRITFRSATRRAPAPGPLDNPPGYSDQGLSWSANGRCIA